MEMPAFNIAYKMKTHEPKYKKLPENFSKNHHTLTLLGVPPSLGESRPQGVDEKVGPGGGQFGGFYSDLPFDLVLNGLLGLRVELF